MSSPLQNRCLVGSVLAHVILCALLLFAPAFKPDSSALAAGGPVLEMVSSSLIDAALSSALPAAEVAPTPPSQPEPVRPTAAVPETPPEPERTLRRPEPKARPQSVLEAPQSPSRDFVVAPKKSPDREKAARKVSPKPREAPKFDFGQVKTMTNARPRRASENRETTRNAPPAEDPSKVRARTLGGILANAAGSLTGTGGGRGAVNIQIAGGGSAAGGGLGGGLGSANPLAIRNAYFAAWVTPPNVSDDLATVETEVTIQRDGTVARSRVTRRSGIAALDRSVEDALQRVKRITPFDPYPDPTLQQQTFKIGFNLRARNQF